MLVLSRKIGEQILIPELNITITVLSAGTNRVQLGIKAPKEIDITRPGIHHSKRTDSVVQPDCDSDQHTSMTPHVFRATKATVPSSFELALQ